jgi:hypothetical protein
MEFLALLTGPLCPTNSYGVTSNTTYQVYYIGLWSFSLQGSTAETTISQSVYILWSLRIGLVSFRCRESQHSQGQKVKLCWSGWAYAGSEVHVIKPRLKIKNAKPRRCSFLVLTRPSPTSRWLAPVRMVALESAVDPFVLRCKLLLTPYVLIVRHGWGLSLWYTCTYFT